MTTMNKRTIEDIQVKGKKVICRVDFNVPLDKSTGAISDDSRIVAALPTIKYLLAEGAAVILVSHLGRPKSSADTKYSLQPCALRLAELLQQPVQLAQDVIGSDAVQKAAALQAGQVLLLENVRFHKEETANEAGFARELAALADIYVNDAFGTAHRAHASTWGLANFLPAVCGYLIQKEIDVMGSALAAPARPFAAILGGSKVSDKIGVIQNLLGKVDSLLIGGGMAYTFLAAQGYQIGNSLFEGDKLELAKDLLAQAAAKGVKILLPQDHVIAERFAADASPQVVVGDIPAGFMGMDIGPASRASFAAEIQQAKTVVWNGPMGVFEFAAFAEGTRAVAQAVASSQAVSIIGGGDSAAAVEMLGFGSQVSHISTGGGASLEFLEGKVLPGIACLQDKNPRRTMAAGNWKMNAGTAKEALKLINALKQNLAESSHRIVLAVPFTVLTEASAACEASNLHIAAQNCHFEDKGAYTGEISAKMLAELQVNYVLLGHSERRQYFAETDATVNQKVKACRHYGLRPIICVGESLAEREAAETLTVIRRQLEGAFAGVSAQDLAFCTIAYEPIWAIGTGRTASDAQAEEVCAAIRGYMAELYSAELAANLTILYGGSVNAQNAAGLFAQANIDGGLVGGASLKADDFTVIAQA